MREAGDAMSTFVRWVHHFKITIDESGAREARGARGARGARTAKVYLAVKHALMTDAAIREGLARARAAAALDAGSAIRAAR
jgi:hypothetical protein